MQEPRLIQIADTIRVETVGGGSDSTPLDIAAPVPELVKTDFVGMNQTLPDERYAEVYEDLAGQSRAVYEDGTKYLLYEDRAAVVEDLPLSPPESTEVVEYLEVDEVPRHIREFAAINHVVEAGSDLEVGEEVKDRLSELGYR